MSGLALLGVFGSLVFPGVGQGLAWHRWRGVVWAVAGVVSLLLILVTVWFLVVALVVRLASAVDAYRCLRRHTPSGLARAAIALVIGAVGVGGVRVVIEGYKIPSSSMYPTLIIGDHVFVDKLSVRWRPPGRGEIIVFTQPCAQRPYIKRVLAVGGDTIEVRCSVTYINGQPVSSTLVERDVAYVDVDGTGADWHERRADRYREVVDGHTFETFRGPEAERGDFPARDRMFPPACTHGEFFGDDRRGGTRSQQPTGELVVTKEIETAGACEQQLHFVVPPGSVFVMGDHRHNANDSRFWGVVPVENVIGRAIGIWLSDGPAGGWDRFGAIE